MESRETPHALARDARGLAQSEGVRRPLCKSAEGREVRTRDTFIKEKKVTSGAQLSGGGSLGKQLGGMREIETRRISHRPATPEEAWQEQLKLKTELDATFASGASPAELDALSRSVEKAFLELRSYQDDAARVSARLSPSRVARPFSQAGLFVNPRFSFHSEADLQPGDILLSRTDALTSAFFANQGDDFGSFSHSSLVGRDANGRLCTVEASGQGLIILPLDDKSSGSWLNQHYGRAMVLRAKDPELASRSAQALMTLARSYAPGAGSQSTPERNFPFNLTNEFRSMDAVTDPSTLRRESNPILADGRAKYRMLCIEAIRLAYRIASQELGREAAIIPATLGTLRRNGDLYEAFGAPERDFLEIDFLQVDPHFDILAEWRDPSQIEAIVQADDAVRATLQHFAAISAKKQSGIVERSMTGLFATFQSLFRASNEYFYLKDVRRDMVEFMIALYRAVRPVRQLFEKEQAKSWREVNAPLSAARVDAIAKTYFGSLAHYRD
jgi:hypothetical protein